MDDLMKAVNEPAEIETAPASTPEVAEQTAEEVAEPSVEATVETPEETTETVDEPKKGASQRIRELNQRAKDAEEKAQSLAQQLAELTGGVSPLDHQGLYMPQFNEGQEIDQATLQQQMQRTALSAAQLISLQERNLSRIDRESNEVVGKFKALDPDSDVFDQDLSDSVTEATKAFIRANPTGSVKQFVEKMMKPYQRSVAKEVGQARVELAKQVSQAATRPTAVVKAPVKSADEKSIKELEAELGFVS